VAKGEGEGADWPALRLSIKNGIEGSTTTIHTDYKPAKKATTGKAYHFYATHDGSTLTFVEESAFTVPDGTVDASGTGILADTRDGNLYATVRIGTQTWMQENLKYLPSVVGPGTGSSSTAYYYVYGYNGTDVATAKATDNYSTYGVLYNWTAAQSACPSGWHLPSDAEWTQLEEYLIANGYNYDGTTTGNQIAKSMANYSGWNTSSTVGAVGNTDYPEYRNKSGFTALPGGYRSTGGPFSNIGKYGYWWISTQLNTTDAWLRYLYYSSSRVFRGVNGKDAGFSVRCVRD
jgi:uncharacterized protein (TIGR02145 family)